MLYPTELLRQVKNMKLSQGKEQEASDNWEANALSRCAAKTYPRCAGTEHIYITAFWRKSQSILREKNGFADGKNLQQSKILKDSGERDMIQYIWDNEGRPLSDFPKEGHTCETNAHNRNGAA